MASSVKRTGTVSAMRKSAYARVYDRSRTNFVLSHLGRSAEPSTATSSVINTPTVFKLSKRLQTSNRSL